MPLGGFNNLILRSRFSRQCEEAVLSAPREGSAQDRKVPEKKKRMGVTLKEGVGEIAFSFAVGNRGVKWQ